MEIILGHVYNHPYLPYRSGPLTRADNGEPLRAILWQFLIYELCFAAVSTHFEDVAVALLSSSKYSSTWINWLNDEQCGATGSQPG